MKSLKFITILCVCALVCGAVSVAEACTSALVGAEKGAGGRWILWKHRDSGHADNYVRRFEATDSTRAYVALFNASDTAAREAWIGFNDAGLAVMNTASYNIPEPAPGWMDREGLVMTEALRRCGSTADFYRLLSEYDGPLGVQANFGAFDAGGCGAYFETSDSCIVVFPVDSLSAVALGSEWHGDAELLTRTNYSMSGGRCNRLGVSRHRAETHLLDSVMTAQRRWAAPGEVAAEDLMETLSRSFYLPERGVDLLDGDRARWPDNGDVISRWSSCASVAIEGPKPGEEPAKTMIMWTAIGFPALSEVRAVTLDSVPEELLPAAVGARPGELRSAQCELVKRRRARAFTDSPRARSRHSFNLPYLRREVPEVRSRSLRAYPAARSRR